MPKKITKEQEDNLREAKKLLEAGFILDRYLWRSGRPTQEFIQLSISRRFKKSSSTNYGNHFFTSVKFFQHWKDHVRKPGDYWSYTVVDKSGVKESHWYEYTVGRLIAKKVKELKLLDGLGQSSLDKTEIKHERWPNEEDIQWARSVLDNYGVNYSHVSLTGNKYKVNYVVNIPMTVSKIIYADSEEHAKQIEDRIKQGDIPYSAEWNTMQASPSLISEGISGKDLIVTSIVKL